MKNQIFSQNFQQTVTTTSSPQSNDSSVPLLIVLFQGACLAVIVLNATFIGNLLYNLFFTKSASVFPYLFLLSISLLNIAEIMNNWTSIKKYFAFYDMKLLLIDVITLGIFYWQIHILSTSQNQHTLEQLFTDPSFTLWKVTLGFCGIIFILYIVWDIYILRQSRIPDFSNIQSSLLQNERIDIQNSIWIRLIQCIIILLLYIYVEPICINSASNLIPYIVLFILYTLYHNSTLNIFNTLIQEHKP